MVAKLFHVFLGLQYSTISDWFKKYVRTDFKINKSNIQHASVLDYNFIFKKGMASVIQYCEMLSSTYVWVVNDSHISFSAVSEKLNLV